MPLGSPSEWRPWVSQHLLTPLQIGLSPAGTCLNCSLMQLNAFVFLPRFPGDLTRDGTNKVGSSPPVRICGFFVYPQVGGPRTGRCTEPLTRTILFHLGSLPTTRLPIRLPSIPHASVSATRFWGPGVMVPSRTNQSLPSRRVYLAEETPTRTHKPAHVSNHRRRSMPSGKVLGTMREVNR